MFVMPSWRTDTPVLMTCSSLRSSYSSFVASTPPKLAMILHGGERAVSSVKTYMELESTVSSAIDSTAVGLTLILLHPLFVVVGQSFEYLQAHLDRRNGNRFRLVVPASSCFISRWERCTCTHTSGQSHNPSAITTSYQTLFHLAQIYMREIGLWIVFGRQADLGCMLVRRSHMSRTYSYTQPGQDGDG
jgi:hypothetical protein